MNKKVAPTFFAVLTIGLIALYLGIFLRLPIHPVLKLLIAAGFVAIIVSMGFVLIKRYREIDKEEPDDLSKY